MWSVILQVNAGANPYSAEAGAAHNTVACANPYPAEAGTAHNTVAYSAFEKRLKTHHPFKEKRRLWSLKVGRMDVDGKFELLMFSLTLK